MNGKSFNFYPPLKNMKKINITYSAARGRADKYKMN